MQETDFDPRSEFLKKVEKRYKSIKGPNSLTNQDILTQAE